MPRVVAASIGVLSVLLVAGCGSPTKARAGDPAGGTGTNRGTSATSAAPSATPTPGTVPVDQVPPGRPASWIPAGVTTTAPWQEPGDIVPRFTLAMFEQPLAGAVSAASYFVTARNWALATLDPAAYLVLCDAPNCRTNAQLLIANRNRGEHWVGGRGALRTWVFRPSNVSRGSVQIVRALVDLQAGHMVDASGHTHHLESASTRTLDLYLRWSGRMWRVADVSLVTS